MTPYERQLVLAYIDTVKKYALWAGLAEDVPRCHLEVLMQAEGLLQLSDRVKRALEVADENG